MIRTLFSTALVLVLAVSTTGCFEELVGPFDLEPQVEFAQIGGGYATAVADDPATVTLTVNLIGAQQATPITVGVTTAGSTAVEGTNFSFPNGSSVTIPANSSFGELDINVLDAGITPGDRVILQLELEDGSGVVAADNLDDFTVTIVGT